MRRILAFLLLAALLAGCAGRPPVDAATTDAGFEVVQSPPATEPVAPYEFRTAIRDGAYEHPRLDAATQATITWTNTGKETHSVVSDDGQFAGSGPISPGGSFTFTFLDAGDYTFHCRYHPDMKGLLVVR